MDGNLEQGFSIVGWSGRDRLRLSTDNCSTEKRTINSSVLIFQRDFCEFLFIFFIIKKKEIAMKKNV